MYDKLSGVTGTAETEAESSWNLWARLFCDSTNKPIARLDHDDVVYVKERFKVNTIVEDIVVPQKATAGPRKTTSVEKSEFISRLLTKNNVNHHVLNAKFHEQQGFNCGAS